MSSSAQPVKVASCPYPTQSRGPDTVLHNRCTIWERKRSNSPLILQQPHGHFTTELASSYFCTKLYTQALLLGFILPNSQKDSQQIAMFVNFEKFSEVLRIILASPTSTEATVEYTQITLSATCVSTGYRHLIQYVKDSCIVAHCFQRC